MCPMDVAHGCGTWMRHMDAAHGCGIWMRHMDAAYGCADMDVAYGCADMHQCSTFVKHMCRARLSSTISKTICQAHLSNKFVKHNDPPHLSSTAVKHNDPPHLSSTAVKHMRQAYLPSTYAKQFAYMTKGSLLIRRNQSMRGTLLASMSRTNSMPSGLPAQSLSVCTTPTQPVGNSVGPEYCCQIERPCQKQILCS